jgi:hypothetical protein
MTEGAVDWRSLRDREARWWNVDAIERVIERGLNPAHSRLAGELMFLYLALKPCGTIFFITVSN